MNWKVFKQLHQLYTTGETSIDVLQVPLVQRWHEMDYLENRDRKTVGKGELYDTIYQKELLQKYQSFETLLATYDLVDTNFKEDDLIALLNVQSDREEILITEKSQKEISILYFNNEKYLKKGATLFTAVLKILRVTELSSTEHDQQFLFVLHCKNKIPKTVILCENLNLLRKPRLNDIELWFAGGRNTDKLKFVAEPLVPIYYLCDWDNKGIEIYQDIKKNIFPKIEILIPQEPIKFSDALSEWKTSIDYSLFPENARQLLGNIIPDKRIAEESIFHSLLRS
jgi:hypothetical protein